MGYYICKIKFNHNKNLSLFAELVNQPTQLVIPSSEVVLHSHN